MANLKLDLLNKIKNEQYYEEMELVRLAQEPNMNYKEKIDSMSNRLAKIASLNAQIGLAEKYFQEPVPPQQVAPQNAPVNAPQGQSTQVHQGQTHGE
jgi:hypothetical protein